jgi:hypothetical protein
MNDLKAENQALRDELAAVKSEKDSLSLYIEHRSHCREVSMCQPLNAEQYKEMLIKREKGQ